MGICTSSTGQCRPHQSPVNINTKKVKHDSSLKPLYIYYDPKSSRRLVNVGHCFNVEFDDTNDKSVLSEGPLTGNYRLRQFHFHWGSSDRDGSEHVIDGQQYPAEIGEANPEIQNIIENLDKVKSRNKECPFTRFDLANLLPKDRNYWTYLGSLTTSPFLECVTWIILREAIPISSQQLDHFRSLLCTAENEEATFILENHRPIQPLEDRVIKSSCKNMVYKH
ncbi:carbonic anhydrase 13-like isoform X2 [Mixophyes fleayi]|uniref:carbonic anhydrase 13-like isoform X2 n=1 Tax=Mixophyes fleayi TaxID=3061075 RepID=UPI003F4DC097